jgi:hypothetical protein
MIMDILHVLIFMIVNVLPANVKECKMYDEQNNILLFTLKQNTDKKWVLENNARDGREPKRTFEISPKTIEEINSETGIKSPHDLSMHLDVAKIKWKSVKKIVMKEPTQTFSIKREKNLVKVIKEGESNALVIKY